MDFFDRQAHAQARTRWLIVYFLLAVVGIIATLQIIFSLILKEPITDLQTLGYVSAGVIAVVVIGSAFKIAELSQGGRVVATMLGGRLVQHATTDFNERKLLNVVEEMALASGVPVPEVYLLPDNTINAFAAGHGPGDTAIGVTQGCIEQLSRDELQGVIAHEFSHILHGDMKLNIRLIGLLNGILGLALVGAFLMRINAYSSIGSSRDRNSNSGNLALAFIVGGLALYLVGWIGVFFGKLIKAAVSRQREFLADASAVQYTRNPQGIAGALFKIGKYYSKLSSPHAEEASHLYFGNGLADPWFALFATHPPLKERIAAIDPNFDPSQIPDLPPPLPRAEETSPVSNLVAALPVAASTAVRDTHGACSMIFSLLLDHDDTARSAQLAAARFDEPTQREVLSLFTQRGNISPEQEIALMDLAIPVLRHLSPQQYADFREKIRVLVESDQQINLFEYLLQKALTRHLELYFTRSTGAAPKYKAIAPLLSEAAVVLSALASADQAPGTRDASFAAGVRELMIKPDLLKRSEGIDLHALDAALDRLAQATPQVKKTFLNACRQVVVHDDIVPPREYQLLRAVADTLDCPMPPLQSQLS